MAPLHRDVSMSHCKNTTGDDMYLGEAIFGKYNVIQNMGISRAVILPSFIKLQKLYFSSQEPACEGTKGGGVG